MERNYLDPMANTVAASTALTAPEVNFMVQKIVKSEIYQVDKSKNQYFLNVSTSGGGNWLANGMVGFFNTKIDYTLL